MEKFKGFNKEEKEGEIVAGKGLSSRNEVERGETLRSDDDKVKNNVETEKAVDNKGKEKEIILTGGQKIATEKIIKELSGGYVDFAIKIKEEFSVPKEIIALPEVQQAAKKEIIRELSIGYPAIKIKEEFSVPKEIITLPEVQQAAKEGMVKRLSSGYMGYIIDAIKIREEFFVPEEVILSYEVQQVAKEGMIKGLSKRHVIAAIKIKEEFSVPEDIAQQVAKEGMIKGLSEGHVDDAIEIKEEFFVSEEITQQAAKEGMIKWLSENMLSEGDVNFAIKIKEEFSVPEDIAQQAAKEEMINRLSKGDVNDAIEIKEGFSVNITHEEIIEGIPEINNLLSELQKVSPEFHNQALKSFDVLMSLFEFKNDPERFLETVKENPFLLDAVSENPKFGSKLLIKYPQLDELSQENIELLFNAKKEILAVNLEIDPESLEFRQMMQEKLAEYESNPEIRDAIKEMGIDFEAWLNYSDTQYFSLDSGKSEVAFSETIATPIKRIKETIDSYAYTIKSVLKEYRKELSEFQVPVEDPKEIEEKIAKMQEAMDIAKDEGNEKKAQGIAKGIEGLNTKLEKLKTVSLWNKLLGDIASFQQLKDGVFESQENLIKIESEFNESASGKSLSGREIQKLKQRMAEGKERLRVKFSALERRTEEFRENLSTLITPALGEDRTTSLTQEIQEKMAEQFDHWDADRQDLASIFSERSDKEKDKMDSQPMSIFVWARNPDTDLYQGNYSDCCIRIDSAHMGAESTIADYNTDLGIQVVNIWDETKNEPITAAWCWLGKDEDGKSALVVDNIESNTLYSSNYPEQLKDELFEYLEKYAKKIGAEKVVMGKSNNDLPTSGELNKMKDDTSKYDKIGGYNRADGYFLEAESHNVKLIWESKEKKSIEEKKEKAQIVKFQNIKVKSMTKNDFSNLLNIEQKVYTREDPELIQGQEIIEDIKKGNGLEYSVALSGKRKGQDEIEMIGYIVAIDDETDEGEKSVYLEDIAVLPETQGQGAGWKMMKEFVTKLKAKAKSQEKPVLLDMHLRENSQAFMEKHKEDLEALGVKLVEEALVADYYDDNEDALYQLYEVK